MASIIGRMFLHSARLGFGLGVLMFCWTEFPWTRPIIIGNVAMFAAYELGRRGR